MAIRKIHHRTTQRKTLTAHDMRIRFLNRIEPSAAEIGCRVSSLGCRTRGSKQRSASQELPPFREFPLAHFVDLASCDYFGVTNANALRAIGWLSCDHSFPTGRTDATVFSKLKDLFRDPWQPVILCGTHACELCQHDCPTGHANLFVPNGSFIFVCPELIIHYIAAHHYRPPVEFLEAVASCENTHTMGYKKKLLESGGRSLVSHLR